IGTPRTIRSALWNRDDNSLIFSHVAVSTGVIGSPETPLYLALIASKSNSGRRSCQISNVSTKRFPARCLYAERNASTIAADTDFSFRGEATMFKTCIFDLLQVYQGRRPPAGYRCCLGASVLLESKPDAGRIGASTNLCGSFPVRLPRKATMSAVS